jgi:glutamyl-tRNA reductase
MKVLLIGLSHKTAPVEIRERLDFSSGVLRSALTHFDSTHRQAHLPDVTEGVILSTCNRTEVYATVRRSETAIPAIIDLLSRACDTPPGDFAEHLYIRDDTMAIEHLFRVACGLDSMVLGEPQILGQITEAYEAALSQKAAGTVLSHLFQAAIHAGKRARTETRIGVNHASVSSVAASLAQHLLGDLTSRRLMLIGAGEMGEIAARALLRRGLSQVVVVNRTFQNAEVLAQSLGGRALSFQQMPKQLPETDIIITATGAPHIILNKKMLISAMLERPDRPLFIIDIAVPRDVDSNVTDLPNVHLRNIDDLQEQAADSVRERELEVPGVEVIVSEALDQTLAWLSTLDVVATITDLRQQFEKLRLCELDRLFHKLDLDDRAQELIAAMSHRLVNKILHKPTLRLKHEAAYGDGPAYTSTVRQLFDLDPKKKEESFRAESRVGLNGRSQYVENLR